MRHTVICGSTTAYPPTSTVSPTPEGVVSQRPRRAILAHQHPATRFIYPRSSSAWMYAVRVPPCTTSTTSYHLRPHSTPAFPPAPPLTKLNKFTALLRYKGHARQVSHAFITRRPDVRCKLPGWFVVVGPAAFLFSWVTLLNPPTTHSRPDIHNSVEQRRRRWERGKTPVLGLRYRRLWLRRHARRSPPPPPPPPNPHALDACIALLLSMRATPRPRCVYRGGAGWCFASSC